MVSRRLLHTITIAPLQIHNAIDFLCTISERPHRKNDKFSNSAYPYIPESGNNIYTDDRHPDMGRKCSERLENALEDIRRRQLMKQKTLDLNG